MTKLPTAFQIPELPSLEVSTTQESAYQRLRNAIMIGTIPPGVSLTIRGLAEILEVSPTPVREALRRLNTEGALQLLDNRRVVTPEMTLEKFDELIKLRILMECHAAESVLPYISEVQIDELELIDQKMDEEIANNNHESITAYNYKFHSMLYKLNPNQVVMPMIESIWLQLGPYSRTAKAEIIENYLVDHHREALEALRSRNAADLRKAIESDIVDGLGTIGRNKLMNASG